MATLETRNRRANVTDETKRYYIRQRKLNLWRAGKLPPVQQQEFLLTKYDVRPEVIPALKPVEMQVRCSGTLHRCTVTPCGRIKFHAHTQKELAALRTLAALGDKTCGCLTLIDRVRTSELWRGPQAVFIKTVQRTRPMRTAVQDQFRPDFESERKPRTVQQRKHRIENDIMNALGDFARDIERGRIEDADHPAGVTVESPTQKYEVGSGWKDSGDMMMTMVVPKSWVLRVKERPQTRHVDGWLCIGFRSLNGLGYAKLCVRVGKKRFEVQEHAVHYNNKTQQWEADTPIAFWRP